MNEPKDDIRRLIEMAVTCGRRKQHSQTGYIHHFYATSSEDESPVTIPLVENGLFALALLRSRTMENAIEAKGLLERLLHFQAPEGNFPIYLHEYPECKDRFVAAHLSLPLLWILKGFHHVLGHDLKKRLEEALFKAVTHSLHTLKEKGAPYPFAVKIAAEAATAGSLLHQHQIEQEGIRLLNELAHDHPACWYSPVHLGTILSALQLVFPRIDQSPWRSFWTHLENTWNRQCCSYIGPCVKEYQAEGEPQVTLYDLYMGYFSGQFSERSSKESMVHLEGALIHPSEEVLNIPAYPLTLRGNIQEAKWELFHHEKYAYSFLEKGSFLNPSIERGFHPFRLIWGTSHDTHSLVYQGGNSQHIGWIHDQNAVEFVFYLNEPIGSEDREKNREIPFYIDLDPEARITIAGEPSTTFNLDDPIEMSSPKGSLSMRFSLEEGEGRFLGHLMRGNRPSQISAKANKRFHAYDWQIFLRCVHRTMPCKVRVNLELN